MNEAIVIGGGLVGSSIAYHLVRQKVKTLLIDRHDPGRATDAGAGIISPETSGSPVEGWLNLAIEAVAYYPTLVAQLQAEGVGETGYARCGELTVAISADEITPFVQFQRLIQAQQQRRGHPAPAELYSVSPEQARELFPLLAPVRGALYYRQADRVDGRLLMQALRRAAEQQGLQVKQASVDRLVLKNGQVTGVVADGQTFEASQVAIAGGAWSQAFARQAGLSIPVEPQRGQLIHLQVAGMETANWPIVMTMRGYYLVPWPDGRVVAGATHEHVGFQPEPTAAGLYEVLGEALRVAPGLAEAKFHEIRVGLRPASLDGLPIVGRVPGLTNLYLATGHGATGLQLGPYNGKIIAELMMGKASPVDLAMFEPGRF